ncbi:hypothetical protein [Lentibacter sp. XHP0401]|uniref:hypothetical protein n=1 Tax=Lentibacter sp. XHP0401 TaxID=2984334 RepID=UPI0021E8B29E|nr:hypothetical protein [Lentibacter sp. XHP0401]MCV2893877.1 hypothetical protein [Lentibacter sp. XHP0401]
MQIVFHAGAHNTDEDRIIKCLLKNRPDFNALGINVPPPGRYRKLMHQTLLAMSEAPPSPDARDILIETILEEEPCERMLLSNENFFCVPNMALRGAQFYDKGHERVDLLSQLFAEDEIEIFLGICNPATYLPAQFRRTKFDDFADMTFGADPRDLRWSDLVYRIRENNPNIALTVWCNEDTPLIWGQIIRELAGIDPNAKIKGGFDLISEIMSAEGMARFRAYLAEHTDMTEFQKRRVIAAFLDKFAREDMIEEELDLPGWTDALVDELTEIYDEDVFEISRIPGVNFIAP